MTFEATNMVDTALLIDARCQRLDTQVKGHDFSLLWLLFLLFVGKGSRVVAPGVSRDSHLTKARWGYFCEGSSNVGVFLWAMFATTTCRQDECLANYFEVASRIAQGKEVGCWRHSRKARLLTIGYTAEKGLHGSI